MSRRATHYAPGDVVHTTRRGVVVRYSPSMGGMHNYSVVCPHGTRVGARTQADAREAARELAQECYQCNEGATA